MDYPDTAAAAAVQVARGEADAAIVIDGAGLGSTIAANKVAGVRAAMCLNETLARYARQHNGANVLALGATLVTRDEALAIVDTFLDTPMREPRYIRRLAKIRDLETRPRELMQNVDLQRLIQIIVEEVTAARGGAVAGALRLPRGAVRVLSRSAARRARSRRDAAGPARVRRRRGQAWRR